MSGVKFFPARPEDFDSGTRTSLVHSNIPLLDAYIGLKSLVGEADHTNIDPVKQQWMFYLRTDGALIEAYDWKRTMFSIGVYEQNQLAGSVESASHVPRQVASAVLIGVDLGPNLSVTGSLATILWLSALRRENQQVSAWSFLKLGALVMPPALLLAIAALMVVV
jgi:Arsenical pump membrane protein